MLSSGNSGLEDIKQAIEQLTLRSHNGGGGHHSSYSTSTYSSMSGSDSCDRHRRPHGIRYSSIDTINTQVFKYMYLSIYVLAKYSCKYFKIRN